MAIQHVLLLPADDGTSIAVAAAWTILTAGGVALLGWVEDELQTTRTMRRDLPIFR